MSTLITVFNLKKKILKHPVFHFLKNGKLEHPSFRKNSDDICNINCIFCTLAGLSHLTLYREIIVTHPEQNYSSAQLQAIKEVDESKGLKSVFEKSGKSV